MEAGEAAWLEGVGNQLGGQTGSLTDADLRTLLRVTKVTADATGIRYLAPLTAYLIGKAAGAAEAAGRAFDLRAAADAISRLAEDWPRPDHDRG